MSNKAIATKANVTVDWKVYRFHLPVLYSGGVQTLDEKAEQQFIDQLMHEEWCERVDYPDITGTYTIMADAEVLEADVCKAILLAAGMEV